MKSEEEKKLEENNQTIEKVDVPELDFSYKENVSENASLDFNNPADVANDDMSADDASRISSKNFPYEISEIKEEDDESEDFEEEKKIEESN